MMVSFQKGSRIAWPGCTRAVVRLEEDFEQTVENESILFDNLPLDSRSGLLNNRCSLRIFEGEMENEIKGVYRRVKR